MVKLIFMVPEQFVEKDILVTNVTESCELGTRTILQPMDWVIKRAAARALVKSW